MFLAAFSGFIAGLIHVVSGPDHLAAVAPFAVDNPRRSWRIGFLWGIGHTGGVWIIGILFFFLRELLPVELLSSWSERLVGVILLAVGFWGLRRVWQQKLHIHKHSHDGETHLHFHIHSDKEHKSHRHAHAPFGIGIMHGLAGSSHLIGVLPALMLPSRSASLAYVITYGISSIIIMTVYSSLIGVLVQRYAVTEKVYKGVMNGFALLAIAVGAYWLMLA